jgi:hypothetical protein
MDFIILESVCFYMNRVFVCLFKSIGITRKIIYGDKYTYLHIDLLVDTGKKNVITCKYI